MEQGPVDQDAALRLVRTYPVAPEKVWRAWTDPQALMQWFGPAGTQAVEASLDLRVGGAWSIAFTTDDGGSHRVGGIYQEVEPPRRLVFSWAWQSTPERVSRVAIALRPVAGGTELQFTHDRFFDDTARTNHQRGWTGTFGKLAAWLEA